MKGNTPNLQREIAGAVNSCSILNLWPGTLPPVGAPSGQQFQLKNSGVVHTIWNMDRGQPTIHPNHRDREDFVRKQ